MEVLFVAFATQYGIASEIRVEANFGAQISGKFSVSHYKCIDSSAALNELNALLAVGYIVILCSIAELSLRARSCMTFGSDTPGITHVILVLFFDLVVLVVMPLVFLSFTAYQDHTSDREGLRIQETLASIPWASTTVSWKRKVNGFFSGLDTFRDLARDRSMLNSTGLVLSILLLLRVIVSSRAHPRVGVLVNTILGQGAIWHTSCYSFRSCSWASRSLATRTLEAKKASSHTPRCSTRSGRYLSPGRATLS